MVDRRLNDGRMVFYELLCAGDDWAEADGLDFFFDLGDEQAHILFEKIFSSAAWIPAQLDVFADTGFVYIRRPFRSVFVKQVREIEVVKGCF